MTRQTQNTTVLESLLGGAARFARTTAEYTAVGIACAAGPFLAYGAEVISQKTIEPAPIVRHVAEEGPVMYRYLKGERTEEETLENLFSPVLQLGGTLWSLAMVGFARKGIRQTQEDRRRSYRAPSQ